MLSFSSQTYFWLFAVLPTAPIHAAPQVELADLARRLAIIDAQRDGSKQKSIQLETECLQLLENTITPQGRGLIYAQMAKIYAQGGLTEPDKIMRYATKALELPLDVETTCQVYVFKADALEITRRTAGAHEGKEITKTLWELCWQAIDFVLQHNPPATRQEVPVVHKFDCPADNEECTAFVEKNQRESEERVRVLMENELVLFRDIFLQKCGALYSESDKDTKAALRRISHRVMQDEKRVLQILDLIQSTVESHERAKDR